MRSYFEPMQDRLSMSLIGNGGTESSGGTSSRTVVSKYATYRRTKSDCHPSTKSDDDVIVYFDWPTKSFKSLVDPASEYRPQSSCSSEVSSSGNRWYQYGSSRSRKDRENEYARTLINARIQKLDPEEARAEVIHRILDRIREDPDLPTIDTGNRRSARAELNSFASKIGKFSLPANTDERFLNERNDFRSRIAVNRGELAKLEQLVNYTFDHREDFIYKPDAPSNKSQVRICMLTIYDDFSFASFYRSRGGDPPPPRSRSLITEPESILRPRRFIENRRRPAIEPVGPASGR